MKKNLSLKKKKNPMQEKEVMPIKEAQAIGMCGWKTSTILKRVKRKHTGYSLCYKTQDSRMKRRLNQDKY